MKIWQLHKYGGEWEDSFDYIIGSYLHPERAEEEKLKAEKAEAELFEHGRRCGNCPFIDEPFARLEHLMLKYPDYCSRAQLRSDEDKRIDCEYFSSHWDEAYFRIVAVEVEE